MLTICIGSPPGSSSALLHQESGILPLGQLVRMVTAKYILRTASNPNPVPNITRVQTEIHKDPRVHQAISWSMKAVWLQKDIGIPQIQPPVSQESPPWEVPPLHVLISNPINKTRHPQEAAKAAYNRILDLNNKNNLPINTYTDASTHQDGKTAWACYVQEEDLDIQGRLPDNIPPPSP